MNHQHFEHLTNIDERFIIELTLLGVLLTFSVHGSVFQTKNRTKKRQPSSPSLCFFLRERAFLAAIRRWFWSVCSFSVEHFLLTKSVFEEAAQHLKSTRFNVTQALHSTCVETLSCFGVSKHFPIFILIINLLGQIITRLKPWERWWLKCLSCGLWCLGLSLIRFVWQSVLRLYNSVQRLILLHNTLCRRSTFMTKNADWFLFCLF